MGAVDNDISFARRRWGCYREIVVSTPVTQQNDIAKMTIVLNGFPQHTAYLLLVVKTRNPTSKLTLRVSQTGVCELIINYTECHIKTEIVIYRIKLKLSNLRICCFSLTSISALCLMSIWEHNEVYSKFTLFTRTYA